MLPERDQDQHGGQTQRRGRGRGRGGNQGQGGGRGRGQDLTAGDNNTASNDIRSVQPVLSYSGAVRMGLGQADQGGGRGLPTTTSRAGGHVEQARPSQVPATNRSREISQHNWPGVQSGNKSAADFRNQNRGGFNQTPRNPGRAGFQHRNNQRSRSSNPHRGANSIRGHSEPRPGRGHSQFNRARVQSESRRGNGFRQPNLRGGQPHSQDNNRRPRPTGGVSTIASSQSSIPPSGTTARPLNQDIAANNIYATPSNTDDVEPNNPRNFKIVSNHLRITKIPDTLYKRTMTFHRPDPKDSNGVARIVFSKKEEIRSAFAALTRGEPPSPGQEQVIPWTIEVNNYAWATDYKDIWSVSSMNLPTKQGPTIACQQDEEIYGPFKWNPPGKDPIDNLYVTFTKEKPLHGIKNKLHDEQSHELEEPIRALNAIIARLMSKSKQDIIPVGANRFYLKDNDNERVVDGLRMKRGYFSSVRPSSLGPLLNINTTTSAFLPSTIVSDFMGNDGLSTLQYKEKLLRGCTVRITYNRESPNGIKDMNLDVNRYKTFQQFGLKCSKQKFFKFPNDVNSTQLPRGATKRTTDPNDPGTTVFDYFNTLGHPIVGDALCVNVGKKTTTMPAFNEESEQSEIDSFMRKQSEAGATWISANLLQIVKDQPTKAFPLNADHTRAMIDSALRGPNINWSYIDNIDLVELGIKGEQKHLIDMGLETQRHLIKISAENLPTPSVIYHDSQTRHVANASWNLAGVKFVDAKRISRLLILNLCNELHKDNKLEQFASGMMGKLREHGVIVTNSYELHDPDRYTVESADARKPVLDTTVVLEKVRSDDHTIVILPEDEPDETYNCIKKVFDLEKGYHVLCISGTKLEKDIGTNARVYGPLFSNLCLKLNIKAGGVNHEFKSEALPNDMTGHTIVLGADVTHPPAGSVIGYPSIACVVGSIDYKFMNYPGSMRLQAGRQEFIEDISAMVTERLQAWSSANGNRAPENMIFYRDGISESQFEGCKNTEIAAIKTLFTRYYQEKNHGTSRIPQLTFIIVGKRHSTRFYPTSTNQVVSHLSDQQIREKQGKINMNLKPGLYVKGIVTSPSPHNFYLQSHNAIKGTARSAHYHVLENGMGLDKDRLAKLTHELCYAFGRATKGVSYAAPAYIADRLCERGRVYLKDRVPTEGFSKPTKPNSTDRVKTHEEVKLWKTQKALDIARSGCWGKYDDQVTSARFNPWHSNLDDVMFWM